MNPPTLRPAPHILYRPVPGSGGILLDLDKQAYLELDPISARTWELLAEEASNRAIVDCLLQEYEADRSTVESDVNRILGHLEAIGALARVAD